MKCFAIVNKRAKVHLEARACCIRTRSLHQINARTWLTLACSSDMLACKFWSEMGGIWLMMLVCRRFAWNSTPSRNGTIDSLEERIFSLLLLVLPPAS